MKTLFTEGQRRALRESTLRLVPVGPMKKVMARFDSAEDFATSKLSGYGGKTASQVAHLIDVASRTRLSMSKVRSEVSAGGEWYFMHKAKVSDLKPHSHGKVKPSGKEDLSKPIVLGKGNAILDGRHRVALAKEQGVRELPAIIPAATLYHLLKGKP